MTSTRLCLPLALLGLLLFGGCSTPAARDLTVAAANYEARSLEAIAAVDSMAQRELQGTPRLDRDAEDDFVSRMTNGPAGIVGEAEIEQALRPFDVDTTAADQARGEILDAMRRHHAEFTAIFADVERAGLLARGTIADRVPPVLDILIAQQVAVARTLNGDGRPRLLAMRGELAAQINQVRRSDMSSADKDAALRNLRRQWLEMEAQEEQLLASTSGALLTAAATGLALREQVQEYGSLSIADLEAIAREMIGFVGAATGRDVTQLNAQVEALAARITADPDFSQAARDLLARVPLRAAHRDVLPIPGE